MRDNFVIDPLISKRQQLLLATQLCRMVLKVSDHYCFHPFAVYLAPTTHLHTFILATCDRAHVWWFASHVLPSYLPITQPRYIASPPFPFALCYERKNPPFAPPKLHNRSFRKSSASDKTRREWMWVINADHNSMACMHLSPHSPSFRHGGNLCRFGRSAMWRFFLVLRWKPLLVLPLSFDADGGLYKT